MKRLRRAKRPRKRYSSCIERISRSYVELGDGLNVAGGGIRHGSVVEVGDLETNQHASITVYHQPKEVLVDNSEDGYLILNREAVETIRKTKEEEQGGDANDLEENDGGREESGDSDCIEEESGDSDCIEEESGDSDCIEEESEDDCVEVLDPRESQKRERESDGETDKRVEICFLVFFYTFLSMSQDFENLKRIVLERRSVRMFNKQPLPEGVLETILGYSLVYSPFCTYLLENSNFPQPSALSYYCCP